MVKPTLGQVFGLSLLGLAAVLALLFYLVFQLSRETLSESSERIRDGASREIGERSPSFWRPRPTRWNSSNRRSIADWSTRVILRRSSRRCSSLLLSTGDIAEITFTYGKKIGFAEDGALQLAVTPRGQVSVVRALSDKEEARFWSRHIHQENGAFVSDRRECQASVTFFDVARRRESGAVISDPTLHATFTTPARRIFPGDCCGAICIGRNSMPIFRRRNVASKSACSKWSPMRGRISLASCGSGLLTQQLDRAVQLKLAPAGQVDPHRIFICDRRGPFDYATLAFRSVGGFRWRPAHRAGQSAAGDRRRARRFEPSRGGRKKAEQFRAFPFRRPGIPHHLSRSARDPGVGSSGSSSRVPITSAASARFATVCSAVSLGIMALLVAGGTFVLRRVKRGLAQIVGESVTMNAFEFSPAPTVSPFRDVSDVLESLEKTKTAMRAMSKYVPVDLVRRLYRSKTEPVLGSELIEISIMFTDIKDFTTSAEQTCAERIGRGAGTLPRHDGEDHSAGGWGHHRQIHRRRDHDVLERAGAGGGACSNGVPGRTALPEASHALSQSPEWRDLPPFETRFGLHQGKALVGHFGAPDRMNYTAMGDAVNLASRLEGLNKQYGTSIIASERIVEDARTHFDFRLLDLVAVKGKTDAIRIYELLGETGAGRAMAETVGAYEAAFEAYVARNFGRSDRPCWRKTATTHPVPFCSTAAAHFNRRRRRGLAAASMSRCRSNSWRDTEYEYFNGDQRGRGAQTLCRPVGQTVPALLCLGMLLPGATLAEEKPRTKLRGSHGPTKSSYKRRKSIALSCSIWARSGATGVT